MSGALAAHPPARPAVDAGDVLRGHGRFLDLAGGRGLSTADEGLAEATLVLVTTGVALLERTRGERQTAELAAAGDVLELGVDDLGPATLRGLRPTRLYLLESPLGKLLDDLPEVGPRLVRACLLRQRLHDRLLGALHLTRIEDRLLVVLGLAAERHGRITPQGVRLDLALTHRQLGWMAAGRRPSVTTAIGLLQSRGHLGFDERERMLIDASAPALRSAGVLAAARMPAAA